MKFNCGPTAIERMDARWKETQRKRQHNIKWHPIFAWWPTRVGSYDCRWFEWVERRDKSLEVSKFSGQIFTKDHYREYDWEYRAI